MQVCSVLNITLDECFPLSSEVRIIAEPGRFYVSTAFTLVANVTSRRETNWKLTDIKGQSWIYSLRLFKVLMTRNSVQYFLDCNAKSPKFTI